MVSDKPIICFTPITEPTAAATFPNTPTRPLPEEELSFIDVASCLNLDIPVVVALTILFFTFDRLVTRPLNP